ncbi:MAG: hypothetical protein EBZ87_00300 [Microbacteriaceae bacterium]|nr:hypothetical protein [Microbacteriaceae bacterium]
MNSELIKDEDIFKQSEARSDAFIQNESSLKDIKLRPFTAGSLLICKKTGNRLITGGQSEDPEFDILSFLYIHAGPVGEVRINSFNKEKFWSGVLAWADKLKISDLEEAGKLIERIITESGLAIASPKDDGKSGASDSPN